MVNTHTQLICLDQPHNRGERVQILHWDGRLDNRRDLLLRLREYLRGNTSDAARRWRPTNDGGRMGWFT